MKDKLALEGGTPVRERPLPEGWPGGWLIGEEEKKEVLEVLESKSLFRHYGPNLLRKVDKLEKEYAEYMGAKYALAVSSGTAALIVALAGLGIGPGDEVILPAYNFIASVGAIIAVKAVPVFCEIDDTLTMDPEDLEKRITPYTKAIMPIHMRGIACDMDRIIPVAKKHNLPIVEDYSQANGASYKGKKIGTFGDVGAASLQYHKVITTGDGGILVTDDNLLYERCVRFHDQGAMRMDEIDGMNPDKLIIGQNFRMNELTAAVGIAQLHKIDRIMEAMKNSKRRIKKEISGIKGITFRRVPDEEGDTGATLIFYLPSEEIAKKFHQALNAENITASLAYYSGQHVYAHFEQIREKKLLSRIKCPWECPYYKGEAKSLEKGMFPKTDSFLKRAIHIDMVPIFTRQDEQDIIDGIHKVARALL